MYRLLIIDDEPYIVDWIYDLFSQYDKLDLDIYKAQSGREALNILGRAKIDIVISDIQMPGMNGIELLSIIQGNWPLCKVIFLTAYPEFEYAQIASKGGVTYLLKTESDEEIIRSVEKAVFELDHALKMDELIQAAARQVELARPIMQREFINELLTEDNSLPVLQSQLDELAISLSASEPVFLVIGRQDDWYVGKSLAERTRQSILIQNVADQYFSPLMTSHSHLFRQSYLVWLIQPKSNQNQPCIDQEDLEKAFTYIKGSIETIQEQCWRTLGTTCSFILNDSPVEWPGIPQSCLAMISDLNHGSANKPGSIQVQTRQNMSQPEQKNRFEFWYRQVQRESERVKVLETYFESGRPDDFFALLVQMEKSVYPAIARFPILMHEIILALSLMFMTYINRFPDLLTLFSDQTDYTILVNHCQGLTYEEAFRKFQEIAGKIFSYQVDDQDRSDRKLVTELQGYIQQHLSSDVSLIKLAELVYLNPTYLSRVYKQLTGTNLSEYIYAQKLGKAKSLLKDSKKRINEIATEVGFESAAYFIRMFKKSTGMTPQEYRENVTD